MEGLEEALLMSVSPPWGLSPDVATWRNHNHVSTRCGDHTIYIQGLYIDVTCTV